MAKPYKDYHARLLAAIGAPASYCAKWSDIAAGATDLVTPDGFEPQRMGVAAAIRSRVAAGSSESAVLRAAAAAPANAAGPAATAGAARALALKTLRHLYMLQSFGKQKIWVLSLPAMLRAFPVEYAASAPATVDAVLDSQGEMFSAEAMKNLGDACQMALAWTGRAMVVAGAPLLPGHRKQFHRWFIPVGAPNDDARITAFARTLLPVLQAIAAGLKTGRLILTDAPHERGSDSGLERSEAFVFYNDLIAIHVEKGFFSTANTLSGVTNWARILVHELSHIYARTADHAYSWQGLLPRDDDALKGPTDRMVNRDPQFPAVRALSHAQCCTNADSWAYFVADAAGALSERDRMQALGARLYDGAAMDPVTATALKQRAA